MTDEYSGSPGLREKIIAIICEEWPNPDNGIEATAFFERLQSEGFEASEQAVRDALFQLADHGKIVLNLPASQHPFSEISIVGVSRQELCE